MPELCMNILWLVVCPRKSRLVGQTYLSFFCFVPWLSITGSIEGRRSGEESLSEGQQAVCQSCSQARTAAARYVCYVITHAYIWFSFIWPIYQSHLTMQEDWIQARCDGVPVSAWTGTLLPRSSPYPLMLLLAAAVCDLPTRTVSLCLAVDSARTAVGRSTMPTQQPGTCWQMNLEILTVLIVLNGSWKQFPLAATSVSSALEVIFIMRCAI